MQHTCQAECSVKCWTSGTNNTLGTANPDMQDKLEPNSKRLKVAFQPKMAPIPEIPVSLLAARPSQDFVDKPYRIVRSQQSVPGGSSRTLCTTVLEETPITLDNTLGTSENEDIPALPYRSLMTDSHLMQSEQCTQQSVRVAEIPCKRQDRYTLGCNDDATHLECTNNSTCSDRLNNLRAKKRDIFNTIMEKVTPSLDVPVGPEDQCSFDNLTKIQKNDIKRIMKDHPILSIRTALEIIQQP